MTPEGTCPTCGRYLDVPTTPSDGADEEEEKAPWHFKLLVVALVVYLGWRFFEMFFADPRSAAGRHGDLFDCPAWSGTPVPEYCTTPATVKPAAEAPVLTSHSNRRPERIGRLDWKSSTSIVPAGPASRIS